MKMSRLALLAITAAAPNAFGPALAATHTVAAGDRAQERDVLALLHDYLRK